MTAADHATGFTDYQLQEYSRAVAAAHARCEQAVAHTRIDGPETPTRASIGLLVACFAFFAVIGLVGLAAGVRKGNWEGVAYGGGSLGLGLVLFVPRLVAFWRAYDQAAFAHRRLARELARLHPRNYQPTPAQVY